MFGVHSLLAVSCCAFCAEVKGSIVPHGSAGCYMISVQSFGDGEIVGYY